MLRILKFELTIIPIRKTGNKRLAMFSVGVDFESFFSVKFEVTIIPFW